MTFKQCRGKCKQFKELSDFTKNKLNKDGYDKICKPCNHEYFAGYRSKYNKKEEIIEKRRKRDKASLQNRVKWIQDIKRDKPCVDCGKVYEPYCMDYDHLEDKVKSISRMVMESAPKERILKEIEKCELVCVICHGDRTRKRTDEKLTNKKYRPSYIRNINYINNAKKIPCVICGNNYGIHNMQFNHINHEDKLMDVCQMKGSTFEVLIKEIAKCEIICVLCHRRKSILEQQAGIYKKNKNLLNTSSNNI